MDTPTAQSDLVSSDKERTALQPASATRTQGDLLVDYLLDAGVSHIFGVPGGAIEPFFDAVARAKKQDKPIDLVVTRHEGSAVFIAEGHSRETGRLSVCCSTTGPGATNMLTGVANAWEENMPMLILTAQTPMAKFGRKALQDSSCAGVDVVGIYKHCTKYSSLVSHPDQLEAKLVRALSAALTPPCGPVHLSLPSDLVNRLLEEPREVHNSLIRQDFSVTTPLALEQLKHKLADAEKLLLFVGDNCPLQGNQLTDFAEAVNALIVCDPSGKAWVDETHPRFRGVFGFSGHQTARDLVLAQDYDLLIGLGIQGDELGTSGWEPRLLSNKMVYIDDSVAAFSRFPGASLHVCGPLTDIVRELTDHARELNSASKDWQCLLDLASAEPLLTPSEQEKACSDDIPIKPQRAFSMLPSLLPDDTRIYLDAGNTWSWGFHYLMRSNCSGHLRLALAYGTMTWAIGNAVGGCLSAPDAPHLCITGDGSYLMASQEITTALQENAPLVMIILNDDGLGMVKHGQRMGGAEQFGYEIPHIDFAALAQAMGIEGIVVNSADDLAAIDFQRLFRKQAPTIIDMRIDPEEKPPMGERIKGLTTARS